MSEKNNKQIKIIKNGPYLVSGGIKLTEKIISKKDGNYIFKEGHVLPQKEKYSLCRCGQTKTPPFCDGQHNYCDFDGHETADMRSFEERAEKIEGPELDLLDDHRCAFARFCHRTTGGAWDLTRNSDDPIKKEEAILASLECPAGRLVPLEKNGQVIEEKHQAEIAILQDPGRQVSGGIFVKGEIEIISARGDKYETRNRVILCRCGESKNMPFCDMGHLHKKYRDWEETE